MKKLFWLLALTACVGDGPQRPFTAEDCLAECGPLKVQSFNPGYCVKDAHPHLLYLCGTMYAANSHRRACTCGETLNVPS